MFALSLSLFVSVFRIFLALWPTLLLSLSLSLFLFMSLYLFLLPLPPPPHTILSHTSNKYARAHRALAPTALSLPTPLFGFLGSAITLDTSDN